MIKKISKKHILSLTTWLFLLILAFFTMPNIGQLVRDKGQVTLPSNLQSMVAEKMATAFTGKSSNDSSIILVFNSDNKLTSKQTQSINNKIEYLKSNKNKFGISKIQTAKDGKEVADQVISKDKTSQIAMVSIKGKEGIVAKSEKIKKIFKIKGVNSYVTGSELMTEELTKTTEEGIKKTEIIAVIFIFIVLILVFKSPIIPLISLSTVGISLIISLNIIMNLAKFLNFPISNFTQVFLVVVLFGIGTDYNILLYDQFKEELSHTNIISKAADLSRRKAGKTILYSGSSVLIGFLVLILAKFSFYQSAVGVAIGVAVLIINLLTFNMFFMNILGRKMFWPVKNFEGSSKSKLWDKLSGFAISRPLLIITILCISFIPFASIYSSQKLNYNNADEIQDSNSIKKGYVVVQQHFSKGMVAPSTLYIENNNSLLTKQYLSEIDDLTYYIKNESGVKQVNSVTQPAGQKIDSFYLKDQLGSLTSGLGQTITGLEKIKSGLNVANDNLSNNSIDNSISAVQNLADGSQAVSDGSNNLNNGISDYTSNVTNLSDAISKFDESNLQLTNAVAQISDGSNDLTGKIKELNDLSSNLKTILAGFQTSNSLDSGNISQLSTMVNAYEQLNSGILQLNDSLNELNNQMPIVSESSNTLLQGSEKLSEYGKTISQSTSQLSKGAKDVNSGVQTLNNQLKDIVPQINTLSGGLQTTLSGITDIENALKAIQNYLDELEKSYLNNQFYIPQNLIDNGSLNKIFDMYMSRDRKVTKLTVLLKSEPSALGSAKTLNKITSDIKSKIKGTALEKSKIAFSGQTSQTADLQKLSISDFFRTAVIMIIGISIALIFVTNSVILPLSVIMTLLGTFVASMGITEILNKIIFDNNLLSWNAPFFTFIMLVALGVDYSIFLLMKYKENVNIGKTSNVNSIRRASLVIGVVVLSAALILGGTFAALIPSGVSTLIQVALGVIVGLLILVIILPLVIPAVVKLSEK